MKRLFVCVLVACDAGVPVPQPVSPPGPQLESSPAPPSTVPLPELPAVTANGHTYAIVQVRGVIPELCTNMGGTDWVFTVEGMPSSYRLHGGGHGIFARDSTLPGPEEELADDISWQQRFYVADISLPSHGRIEQRSPCTREPAMYDGTVLAVAPMRDLADARAQLAATPRKGLPTALRIDQFGR